MGAAMTAAGLGAPFAKITSDVLAKVFPVPEYDAKTKQFHIKLYDETLKDKKLTEQQKMETMAYLEQLTDKTVKTLSDGLWAGFQTVQAATKGLRENVVLGKLADAYSSVLTDALPLDAMYENRLFWDVVYGGKKASSETWSRVVGNKEELSKRFKEKVYPFDLLVSSPYGPRVINGKDDDHEAIDLSANGVDGLIAKAPQSGKVMQAGYAANAGNMVNYVVRADDGSACFVRTLHHDKVFVKAGDTFDPGQPLAEVSNKGTSEKHVHLETGYADKPPEASVKVKMKKGFDPAGFKGVSYKNGTLTVKGEAAKAFKDKLAAQAEDKAAVEGLFTDFKTRKYTYDEIVKMDPATFKKTIDWKKDVKKLDPYKGELSKQLVPVVIRDMKRQIVAKKVAEEIAARQKNLLKVKPKQETKPKQDKTKADKPRAVVPKPSQAPAHVGH
jgi:murein DD-endopeptidase MepM/ murein hydrolase activator NlpD